jgi:hypothetical protein
MFARAYISESVKYTLLLSGTETPFTPTAGLRGIILSRAAFRSA